MTHNQAIEFVVTIADRTISRVQVTHSTLTDTDSSRAIVIPSAAFRICSDKDSDTNCDGSLKAPDVIGLSATPQQRLAYKATLWLKVDAEKIPNGSFAGTLTLDTNGANDSKTLSLTLQRTSSHARAIGLVLLAAGVVLAWFLTVFARSRLNRDQALLPIALQVQKLESLRSQLALLTAFAIDLKLTGPAIDSSLQDLRVANLDAKQLLPPVITGLTQSTNSQLTAYQEFLQRESQIVENLAIIVVGIESAVAVLPATPRPADLHGLVEKIDALSGTVPQDPTSLRNQIKALIDSYNSTPGPRALAEAQSTSLC